ncbi:MAG: hypothetical protein ERJ67_02545 [Aphanocapsa feldmannii 277cV]|uniref:Autotransporter outer membrane beta-barrel domain-containing protein n=1 Tax=Aphanocapsa feldmannii 277cV TaxID=2507553 RepID=A0A524RQ30_9CHRO|nr:MAG: hypothetical protein ERJ67_02545 [Aphanocapsa feldmannii 277cV]
MTKQAVDHAGQQGFSDEAEAIVRAFLKQAKSSLFTALLLSIASISAVTAQEKSPESSRQGSLQLGTHASTLGLGVLGGYDFSKVFSARALVNHYDFDYDLEESDNKYKGDLKLSSFGLLLDARPFRNGWKISGGALINNNDFSASTSGTVGVDIDINGQNYSSDLNGNLDANIDFDEIAPYLGIGWNSRQGKSGLSFFWDAGVLFHGAPKLQASGSLASNDFGYNCNFDINENGTATLTGNNCDALQAQYETLKEDLENEHESLQDELDKFKIYPVISLGISYRF